MHRGLMGGQHWVGGATARWGVEAIVGVGGQQGGGDVSTSKNRPSHHKYKSPKQFKLKGSNSAQCPLGATCLSRF